MADLDLTRGRPESSGPRPSGSAAAENARRKAEDSLRERLEEVFSRISGAYGAREDEELAAAFGEDAAVMSNSLVSLTANVKPLRRPLVLGLSFVEPILAFGRVLAIYISRFKDRRVEEEATG